MAPGDAKVLTLRNLKLGILPPEHLVFTTEELTGVNLTENELVTLPKWVMRWGSVVILDLSYNKLVRSLFSIEIFIRNLSSEIFTSRNIGLDQYAPASPCTQ